VSGIRRAQQAPGELELVRDYANTLRLAGGADKIATPAGLRRWLATRDLVEAGKPVGAEDLRRAVTFRGTVRGLLAANADLEPSSDAVREFNAALDWMGASPRLVSLRRTGMVSATADLRGAMGRLAGIVLDAVNAGTFTRLKLCATVDCRLAFYDHGRNAAGRWCDMALCGNRAKVAAHRSRRQGSPAIADQPRSVDEALVRTVFHDGRGTSGQRR
jgi:predicted RNA-binding Zn ribbon-like protein